MSGFVKSKKIFFIPIKLFHILLDNNITSSMRIYNDCKKLRFYQELTTRERVLLHNII